MPSNALKKPFPKTVKILIEQHQDGFVGYPLGLKGVVLGEGDTLDEAFADTSSALRYHFEEFGTDNTMDNHFPLDVFLREVQITL